MSLVRKTHRIQDYTTISSVGSVGQQMAGHQLETTEPGTTEAETSALYLFDSASMTTDEKGSFGLTAVGSPSNTNGIFGSNYAASFNGTSDWYNTNVWSSANPSAMIIDCWVKFPALPSSGSDYFIGNTTSSWGLGVNDDGSANWYTTSYSSINSSSGTFTANTWYHVTAYWNSTNGKGIYVDGVLVASDPSATTFAPSAPSGTATTIGQVWGVGTYGTNCILSNVRFRDKVLTQKDVDVAYASKYSWSQDSTFTLADAEITPYVQEEGNADFISQYRGDFEMARFNDKIYRYGNIFNSTDKLKIVGKE